MAGVNVMQYRYKEGFGVTWLGAEPVGAARVEGFMSLGEISDPAEAARLAQSALRFSSNPPPTYGVTVYPRGIADSPWFGFNTGDTIRVDNTDGGLTTQRVVSVGGSVDADGDPIPVVELGSLAIVEEELNQRLIQRMLAGGLGGMSSNTGRIGRTDAKFDAGKLTRGDCPEFSIPGEVEISRSAPHQFDQPTRLVGWGLGADTFGLGTTTIRFLINGVMQTGFDQLSLLSSQKLALRMLFGQYLVLAKGDVLQIEVTAVGQHEDVSAKFVGVESV